MNKFTENTPKTRCFFANKCFRYAPCDSNHKKQGHKSSTIPSQRINGLPLLGNLCMFI
jgi:hypothetical protein